MCYNVITISRYNMSEILQKDGDEHNIIIVITLLVVTIKIIFVVEYCWRGGNWN